LADGSVPTRDAADVAAAWEAGLLSWKLDSNQDGIYQHIFSCGRKRYVLNCSRRLGKTFLLVLIAIEFALKHKKAKIKFAASTADDLEEIVLPLFDEILGDCPAHLKPKWRASKQKFLFPATGSEIKLAGCDDRRKANRLRGTAAHLVIVEEAGSIPELQYVVRSVLAPQLISTGGMMLFASTPPDSPGHEFVAEVKKAQATGAYSHRTIYDCPRYTKEQIAEFIREEAGDMPIEEYVQTEDFRREFMAEILTDPTRAVLKYATEANLKRCVELYTRLSRPTHRLWLEGMDVGWSPDFTAWVLAWWHYEERVLVFEREALDRRMSSDTLGKAILEAEREAMGPQRLSRFKDGWAKPRRWSDYDPRLLHELANDHDLEFAPTAKDDKDTALDNLSRMVAGYNGRIAINAEGCPKLLQHFQFAVWNKQRSAYARTKEHGHFDLVDAAVYLARNVPRTEDPRPEGHGYDPGTQYSARAPGSGLSGVALTLQNLLCGKF
jgi:hypothetical protein